MSGLAQLGELRRIPARIVHPYLVVGPSLERLGLVGEPVLVAKLLAADCQATCHMGRRGIVYLTDLDSWLTLFRTFELRDFLPESWVCRSRAAIGSLFYELIPARRILRKLGVCDSRHPDYRANPGRNKRPLSRRARRRLALASKAAPRATE
jgi:hypothetical protein